MTKEVEEIMRNQEKYFAGFHDGEDKGRHDGKLEGRLETQTLIIKNLLNKNMTDLEIMEITNLNKDELEKIKKELIN